MSILDRVRARLPTGAGSDALLNELILDAQALTLAYVNRDVLPEECESAVVRLAVALYNRLGMEGESSHTEGGLTVSAQAVPGDVQAMLRPYRLARGITHETNENDEGN